MFMKKYIAFILTIFSLPVFANQAPAVDDSFNYFNVGGNGFFYVNTGVGYRIKSDSGKYAIDHVGSLYLTRSMVDDVALPFVSYKCSLLRYMGSGHSYIGLGGEVISSMWMFGNEPYIIPNIQFIVGRENKNREPKLVQLGVNLIALPVLVYAFETTYSTKATALLAGATLFSLSVGF